MEKSNWKFIPREYSLSEDSDWNRNVKTEIKDSTSATYPLRTKLGSLIGWLIVFEEGN